MPATVTATDVEPGQTIALGSHTARVLAPAEDHPRRHWEVVVPLVWTGGGPETVALGRDQVLALV